MRNHRRHGIVDGAPILLPASILQVIEQFYDYILIPAFIGFINIVEFDTVSNCVLQIRLMDIYKRLTVRFRSDDPAIAELYTTLQQKRRTTRKTMNTLVLNALQVAFGWEDHSEQRLRAIVREEVRAAMQDWAPQSQPRVVEEVSAVPVDDDSDFDSLAAAVDFTF